MTELGLGGTTLTGLVECAEEEAEETERPREWTAEELKELYGRRSATDTSTILTTLKRYLPHTIQKLNPEPEKRVLLDGLHKELDEH